MKILPSNKKGFTLVETLVAISILLIAIAGPLTIAAKGLNSSYFARDQITAYYLAQEGVEYIRNLRDANSLARIAPGGDPSVFWLQFDKLNDITPCLTSTGCDVDTKNAAIIDCTNSAGQICIPLSLDSNGTDSFYDHQTGAPDSRFTRRITMQPVAPNNTSGNDSKAYSITSTVTWTSTRPDNVYSVSEDITNWEN